MWLIAACAVAGLAAGTLVNHAIDRVPGFEVPAPVSGPVACRHCGTPLPAFDQVPLLPWLLRVGKCRACGARQSVRLPLVEIATAAAFGGVAARFGPSPVVPAYCVFMAALLAVALIDLDRFIVPNRIVYPTLGAAIVLLTVAAAVGRAWAAWEHGAIGGVAGFVALYLIYFVYPRGMGFGDVRLAGVIGVYLGWLGLPSLAVGLFLAFLLAAVVGLALMVARLAGRKTEVPFAPFLAAGAAVTVLWGHPLVAWWLPSTVR